MQEALQFLQAIAPPFISRENICKNRIFFGKFICIIYFILLKAVYRYGANYERFIAYFS
jgi:hypothetical protein